MPKIVDHDVQRDRFSSAAMNLVAREGLEGVTMRAVAAEAGLSYGSLFHYFASKDELLIHAIERLMSAQTQRVNDFTSRYSGLEALEHLLCDDAIVDERSRELWRVWLAFLYKASLQKSFARLHASLIEGWLGRIRALLAEARDAGELRSDIDIEEEAVAIWAYSAGIGQMGLLDARVLPPQLQKRLIVAYLDKIRATE